MSAPTPSSITQKKEKNYIIELDSKSYNLSFILSDSLIIISFIDNISIPQKIYEEKFSYDSISKKSKIRSKIRCIDDAVGVRNTVVTANNIANCTG